MRSAGCRAAPGPGRIPAGDGSMAPPDEGQT